MPIFPTILGKFVYSKFLNYLEENHLLDDWQHGFRQGRSKITESANFIERIIKFEIPWKAMKRL